MDPREQELSELRLQLTDLQRRIERLEAASPAVKPSPAPVAPTPPAATVPPKPTAPPPSTPVPPRPPVFAQVQPQRSAESLESRIGTHWLNRVGIIAVLVGVAYFLKYAFDNGWIGATGRVAIGLLAGIAITVWSESFRKKNYALFSYGLKAIGIGTLYLSLWAAVQVYHLIPAGVGFFAMLIVTAATVVMALTQNAHLLAAYALAGSFSTPALCSTGQNHEIFLFSYTAILAAGAVVLTALRGWRRLSLGAFVGTQLMYVAWYATFYNYSEFTTTVFFATLFFLIFAAAALVPRTGEQADSNVIAAILAIANAAVYFLTMYVMFDDVHFQYVRNDACAWLAVGLAGFYVFTAQSIAKQAGGAENRRLLNLVHLALAVGFLTTAIPLKLNGHWITIGWLVESAAILYVARRICHHILKTFASVALVLGLARMLIDSWPREAVLFFNPRFGTYLVAIAVLALIAYCTRASESDAERMAGYAAGVFLNVMALLALYYEVQDFFQPQIAAQWTSRSYAAARSTEMICSFTHSAVWMIYGAVLMFLGFRRRSAFLRWQAIALLGVTIIKVFLFDTSMLDLGYRILSFIGLGVILLAISFLYQRGRLSLPGTGTSPGTHIEP
jgi:uncharacterized membrane protein